MGIRTAPPSKHVRQIGADQVAALVQLSGVPFRASSLRSETHLLIFPRWPCCAMSFTIARTGLKSDNPNVTAVKGEPEEDRER